MLTRKYSKWIRNQIFKIVEWWKITKVLKRLLRSKYFVFALIYDKTII